MRVVRALALVLAGSLAANSAGPACLVLACPMGAPCEEMAAMAGQGPCCAVNLSAPAVTCCDADGLTAALRKPAGDDLALPAEPMFAGPLCERPPGEQAFIPPSVPPAPPPDGGLYTLHSTFLI